MTIVTDLATLFSGYDAKIAAADIALASLASAQADAASAHAGLTAALAADALDKSALTDALAKLATANTTLAQAQTDLAKAQADDVSDKSLIATLTDQLAAANAKIASLSSASTSGSGTGTTTGTGTGTSTGTGTGTSTSTPPASTSNPNAPAASPASTLAWANWHGGQGTSAVAAPDGTYTATRIVSQVSDYASFYKSDEASVSGNAVQTRVIYVHEDDMTSGEWHYSTASDGTGCAITFSLDTAKAALLKEYGTGKYQSSSVVSIGGGWFQVAITGTLSNTADALQPFPALVVPAGNNGKGFTTWGYLAVDGPVAPALVSYVAPKPVPKGSLQMTAPFSATEITINQAVAGAISSIGLLGSDMIVQAGQTVFSGTCSTNILNVEVYDPTNTAHRGTVDGNGGWSVTIDTTTFPTAPTVFVLRAWDSPPGGSYTVDLRGSVTVYLNNPAQPVPAMTAPALASGLKLIFSEDFSSGKIDTTKWQTGLRNNVAGGAQWGSDAYFGVLGTDSFAGDSYAVPMPRFGRLRAIHDLTYKNPAGWNQPWRSGLLSTAMVDPNNAKPVVSMKRGIVYFRAMMPAGKGPWPSLWGDTVNAPVANGGDAQETDLIENNADAGANGFMTTTHLWATDSSRNASDGKYQQAAGNILNAFHDFVFDVGVTDPDNIIIYIDGVQTGKITIYPPAKANATYLMIDMAMGGGWPVEVPPGGIYDLHIQNFAMWSAD